MLDSELRNQPMPTIFDNTMRSMFVSCPRQFYYFMRRFVSNKQSTPVYFTYGRAFHSGLLYWYTHPELDFHTRKQNSIATAVGLWTDEGTLDKPPLDTLQNLIAKLDGYFEFYPDEDFEFIPHGGEAGWIYPLRGTPFELAGAMDGYVRWSEKGIFALEHKTTSQYLMPSYTEQWNFATQITGYVWYLNQILQREEIYGAMVNMITKNIKTPRSNWKYPEYQRILIRKLQWQLDKFEEDIIHDFIEFSCCWESWKWPQRGMTFAANCVGGPGKSPCIYRAICLTPVRLDEIDIRRYVGLVETEEKWEPWKRLEES